MFILLMKLGLNLGWVESSICSLTNSPNYQAVIHIVEVKGVFLRTEILSGPIHFRYM